jgi:hypothetical protein
MTRRGFGSGNAKLEPKAHLHGQTEYIPGQALPSLARIIHQELADVVYSFEISYDFAVESQNPRIQRPHPPWWKLPHLCPACHLFLARR